MTCGICGKEADRVICEDCDCKLGDIDDPEWLRAAAIWLSGEDD